MTDRDLDEPTFQSPEWQRKRAVGAPLEIFPSIGVAHERRPEPTPQDAMRWTSVPPAQQGWFWLRSHGHSAIPVYVFRRGLSFYVLDTDGQREADVRGFWRDQWSSAPISEPEPTDD